MSATTEFRSARDAREAVALACRTYGRKRGWHLAAGLLGVSERVIKAITYGESARVCPIAAAAARLAIARQRAAQIRAELTELEGHLAHDRVVLDMAGAPDGEAR